MALPYLFNIFQQISGLQISVVYFSYFSTKTYVVGTQRTISMRRCFWAPITNVKSDRKEIIHNFMLKIFVYLHLWDMDEQCRSTRCPYHEQKESIYIDKLKIWTDMGALNIRDNYSKMAIHLSVNTKHSVTALDNKVFCCCCCFLPQTLLWCSLEASQWGDFNEYT